MMRFRLFLVCSLAVAVAAFSAIDLSAGCRCQRGARKQAKYERKMARRCQAPVQYQYDQSTPSHYSNPYGTDQVQPVGVAATVETEVVWQCGPYGCRAVRVPVARPVVPIPAKGPQADPAFEVPPLEADKPAPQVRDVEAKNDSLRSTDAWLRELMASETEAR